MSNWSIEETSKHQDHVIAHVIGTSVLGYFVRDESLHILLDIGFIWTIYLDGQMVLLPSGTAIKELEVDEEEKLQLNREIELLEKDSQTTVGPSLVTPSPVECLITEVGFHASGERRRIVLMGETASLAMETSLATGQIEVGFEV